MWVKNLKNIKIFHFSSVSLCKKWVQACLKCDPIDLDCEFACMCMYKYKYVFVMDVVVPYGRYGMVPYHTNHHATICMLHIMCQHSCHYQNVSHRPSSDRPCNCGAKSSCKKEKRFPFARKGARRLQRSTLVAIEWLLLSSIIIPQKTRTEDPSIHPSIRPSHTKSFAFVLPTKHSVRPTSLFGILTLADCLLPSFLLPWRFFQ